MQALLPRFHDMCDADPKKNPWCSRGLRFVFTGVQGDLKWLLSRYDLHNYAKNACCSLCNAVKNDPDPRKTIACFTEANQFVHVSHETFCAERGLDEWPAPMIYGVRLERFLHDVAHSQLLGTGKTLNGSALIFLCESGEFSPNGSFPTRGTYTVNLNAALRVAYVGFKTWVKRAGLRVNQPRFTYSRLNRKNRVTHPCLASKAVSGKIISFWLASRCVERSERAGASDVEKLVALCTHSYASMLKMMDEAPLVMTPQQADDLYDVGNRHLQTYARLRALSAEVTRGKTPNRSSWTILPKHHHLWHALLQSKETRVNLNSYNLLAAESWVGIIGRMARLLGQKWNASFCRFQSVYFRIAIYPIMHLSKITKDNTSQCCKSTHYPTLSLRSPSSAIKAGSETGAPAVTRRCSPAP